MTEKQQTLAGACSFSGKGLHTGATVNLTILPAAEGHGIKFCRTDLDGRPMIDAVAENVAQTSRSTVLKKGEATVSTVEHLMAALWGCGVDNALVEVDGGEVPIADGSAMPWVKLIRQAGIVEQAQNRKYYEISEKTVLSSGENNTTEIIAYPDDTFSAVVNVDFGSKVVGQQYAVFAENEDFAEVVAPSRTFVFLHEIEPLIQNNQIRGGDLDNAIVIVEQPVSADKAAQIGKLFGREGISADRQGYLNNLDLHFDNEIARHKLLDLLGVDQVRRDALSSRAQETVRETGASIAAAVVESLAQSVLYGILYLLSFSLLTIALHLLVRMLDAVLKLPGLHGLNALGGGLIGLAEGALLLFLAVWVLRLLGMSFDGQESSWIFRFFTTHSPLDALAFLGL